MSSALEDCVHYSSTYKTADTDACKTHCTITVYTSVFLKMNTQVRNVEDIKNKKLRY